MRKEIRKLDKLNSTMSGVFNPNGLEIITNSEVWDLRTFHLLNTIPSLDQCRVRTNSAKPRSESLTNSSRFFPCFQASFNNAGDIIYAVALEEEDEEGEQRYKTSFKTFDAGDYSSIGETAFFSRNSDP